MKYVLSYIFIFIIQFSFAQDYGYNKRNINRQALKYVDSLKDNYIFEGEFVGIGGRKPKAYKIFENILNSTSIEELVELSKHPKPIIRYYAVHGLELKKASTEILLPIVYTHLNDTTTIMVQWGCLRDYSQVGEYILKQIPKAYHDRHPKVKDKIDSLLLYSKGPLISSANEYLKTLPKTEKLRLRLQDMVKYENNPHALDLLLSYNNPEDWIYIRHLLYSHPIPILKGIAKYPKQEFIKPLQWWKTTMTVPYKDPMTWDRLPQNPGIIWGVYKAFMSYESSIRTKYFTDIFKSNLSIEIKALHADIIYDLIKTDTQPWTYLIKLNILPYLTEFDEGFINDLNHKYPEETLKIIQGLAVRQAPFVNDKNAKIIMNYLIKHSSKNEDDFIKDEMNKDLNPECFLILYNRTIQEHPELEEYYILNRLGQILQRNIITIHWKFRDILEEIETPELTYKIWWMCYHYIQQKRDGPILPLLKIMNHYYRDKTVNLCLNYIQSGKLKTYPTWDMFNLVWRKRDPKIDLRLKSFYDNQSYTFKQTKFGLYIHQRLYPETYNKLIQRWVRERIIKRYVWPDF